MAHISDNSKTNLKEVMVDYDADVRATHSLPKELRDFIMYEADTPYDAIQVRQMLYSLTAKEVLHALRTAQYNDRSKFYPGLDTPPRVCYDKDALWWSNFGG